MLTVWVLFLGLLLVPVTGSARGGHGGGGHGGGGHAGGGHGGGHAGGGHGGGHSGGGHFSGARGHAVGAYRFYGYGPGVYPGAYYDPWYYGPYYGPVPPALPYYGEYGPEPASAGPVPQASYYPGPAPVVTPADTGPAGAAGEWVTVPAQEVSGIWVPEHRVWLPAAP